MTKSLAEAETTAIRCKEFLRRCNSIMPVCPICKGNLKTWENLAENKTIRIGHVDGCELDCEITP